MRLESFKYSTFSLQFHPYPCLERGGARPDSNFATNQNLTLWNFDIFPNPTNNQISIVSKTENQILDILIKDLSGREVFYKQLKANGVIANIDLNLINGVYFISVTNQNNETITKKLLVAK